MLYRGVACLKFNVRNCGDVVNAFLQQQKNKKGAFTNSVDPNETSQLGLRYLPC